MAGRHPARRQRGLQAGTFEPAASGFSEDDAQFLAANGFNVVRLGVIWAAVEPQPGVYDTEYLASLSQTVQMLADHGIYTLLDMHQDLYSSTFAGEGAPRSGRHRPVDCPTRTSASRAATT